MGGVYWDKFWLVRGLTYIIQVGKSLSSGFILNFILPRVGIQMHSLGGLQVTNLLLCPKDFILSKHSSWWRRLEDVFCLRLQKTSARRLDQDEYIHLTHTLQKTSSRRLDQDQYIRLGHTSSRRLQDVFKISCQDVFKTSCKNVFKTFSKLLQDVFKVSSRHFQDVLLRRF